MLFFKKKVKKEEIEEKEESLFTKAITSYKYSKFLDTYNLLKAASLKDDTGRAEFCLGLLSINYNCVPKDEQDINVFVDHMVKSMRSGYDLAFGVVLYYFECSNQFDYLLELIENNIDDVDDALFNLYVAKAYMGMFSEEEKYTNFEIADKAINKAIKSAFSAYKNYLNDREEEIEYSLYSEFDKSLNLSNILGLTYWAYGRIMFLWSGNFSKEEFVNLINLSLKYLNVKADILGTYQLYLIAIFNDYFGLKDLALANEIIEKFDAVYLTFDSDLMKIYKDRYDYIWDKYNEFYNKESTRLRERKITFSDIDDHNDVSLENVADALNKWSQSNRTEESKEVYYMIDGRKYHKGELNYLYDEYGTKTNLRVDELERLIDEQNNELGYFNMHGIFISSK